jgi:hypothetical protein
MGKFKIFHSERPVVCGPAPATPAAEPTSEGAATVTSPMIAAREVPGNPAFRGDESQTSGRWKSAALGTVTKITVDRSSVLSHNVTHN